MAEIYLPGREFTVVDDTASLCDSCSYQLAEDPIRRHVLNAQLSLYTQITCLKEESTSASENECQTFSAQQLVNAHMLPTLTEVNVEEAKGTFVDANDLVRPEERILDAINSALIFGRAFVIADDRSTSILFDKEGEWNGEFAYGVKGRTFAIDSVWVQVDGQHRPMVCFRLSDIEKFINIPSILLREESGFPSLLYCHLSHAKNSSLQMKTCCAKAELHPPHVEYETYPLSRR